MALDGLDGGDRFLLIERSTRDNRYWFSTFPTAEMAGQANIDQEYAGDWDCEAVVDLDTGDFYDIQFTAVAVKRTTKET